MLSGESENREFVELDFLLSEKRYVQAEISLRKTKPVMIKAYVHQTDWNIYEPKFKLNQVVNKFSKSGHK